MSNGRGHFSQIIVLTPFLSFDVDRTTDRQKPKEEERVLFVNL